MDPQKGWAVGEGGTILHTSDGGVTWKLQDSGTHAKLVRVTFVDSNVGWAVGQFGAILHTSDGGSTWQRRDVDSIHSDHLAGVSFVDEKTGWVIPERGSVVLRTDDGGVTWARQPFGSTDARSDMAFVDALHGWAALAGGGVLRTSDGGFTWQHHPGIRGGITGLFFLDESHGWIAGWRDKGPGVQFTRFLSDGMVARTTDGGNSWTRSDSRTGRFLWDVAFVDARKGWAVGWSGAILQSADGGATWKPQPSGTQQTLRGVAFPDASNGWAVGDGGTILKFTRR